MGLVRSIAGLFARFSKPAPPSDPRHSLGRQGERLAEKFLKRNGYKILYRNFRAKGGGEVDLVCRDIPEKMLVFAEVKTRSSDEFGRPAEAVNQHKQELISRGARTWLRLLDRPEVNFRFDIVEVILDGAGARINVIKSAFLLPEERHGRR
jgi:putative endonuclease